MFMKKKKLLIAAGLLLGMLSLSGLALSSYSGKTDTVENTIFLVQGEKNQENAGAILEPGWDASGGPIAAAGLALNQMVQKDPYIRSDVDWPAWAFIKVEIPILTEAPNTGKEAVSLLNLNADNKWTLISDVSTEETRTLIYGYNEILPGGNSEKSEDERAKTSFLFDSFQVAGDISLTEPYQGHIRITGKLMQSDGHETVEDAVADAEVENTITYVLAGGVLSGEKRQYSAGDYGYIPPTPVKDGYTFEGWEPESLSEDSAGPVKFTAKWKEKENVFTVTYNANGGYCNGDSSNTENAVTYKKAGFLPLLTV